MSVSLDTASLSRCLSASSCSLLIPSTPHPPSTSSLLPLTISLLSVPWLSASAHHYTSIRYLPPASRSTTSLVSSFSISLSLVSPCSPGKRSFPASPPVSQPAASEWSNAGRWGTEHSLLRRGSGLLIRPLWVEEVEGSFNYVTSTQPLHPDDAVQPARLSLPGLNGERSPPA